MQQAHLLGNSAEDRCKFNTFNANEYLYKYWIGVFKSPIIVKPKTVIANFMKSVQSIIIWTILVFVTLTLLTMKNEAASDGFDTYGFPFTFFDHFGGKCDDCYNKFGFKITNLLTDILFALTSGFLITILKRKFSNKSKGIRKFEK